MCISLLWASKSAGAKSDVKEVIIRISLGDVPKIYGFVELVLTHSLFSNIVVLFVKTSFLYCKNAITIFINILCNENSAMNQ